MRYFAIFHRGHRCFVGAVRAPNAVAAKRLMEQHANDELLTERQLRATRITAALAELFAAGGDLVRL